MYFTTDKTITIASDYYSSDELFNWIINHFDPIPTIEEFGKEAIEAQDIVTDIFNYRYDEWYDDFLAEYPKDEVIQYMAPEELTEELEEFLKYRLIAYYNEYLNNYWNNENSSCS